MQTGGTDTVAAVADLSAVVTIADVVDADAADAVVANAVVADDADADADAGIAG